MTTEQRLSRLERENAWLKRFAAVAVVLAGVFGFVAAEQKTEAPKLIEAQQFNLVDASGKRLAILGKLRDDLGGGGMLMILDDKDRTDVIVSCKGVSAPGFTTTDDAKQSK